MVWIIRSIISGHKIDREVKNSIGNGEAKELICTTHGHELGGRQGNAGGMGCRAEGEKNGKTVIA